MKILLVISCLLMVTGFANAAKSDPAVCKGFSDVIEQKLQDYAFHRVVLNFGSANISVKLGEIANDLEEVKINVILSQQNGCAPRSEPIGRENYIDDAYKCKDIIEKHGSYLPDCKAWKWKSNAVLSR